MFQTYRRQLAPHDLHDDLTNPGLASDSSSGHTLAVKPSLAVIFHDLGLVELAAAMLGETPLPDL